MLIGNNVRLHAMVTTDTEAILKIYEEGIQTGHATFEAEVPDWHKWDSELAQNQGIGSVLLERLITSSKKFGFCKLQAYVFPENKISIHVHEKPGFRKSGTHIQLAFLSYGFIAG